MPKRVAAGFRTQLLNLKFLENFAEFSIQLSGEKILGIFTTRPYNDRY